MKTIIENFQDRGHVPLWVTNYRTRFPECSVCNGDRVVIIDNVIKKCDCLRRPLWPDAVNVGIEAYVIAGKPVKSLFMRGVVTNTELVIGGHVEGYAWVHDNDLSMLSVYNTFQEAQEHFAEDKKKIEAGIARSERIQKEITEANRG